MPRPYTQKQRAEQQAQTRRRIVEAAVSLHGSVGPARTTISMIAERAGVQRHTVYAHFPDEWTLNLACSGLFFERDPLPDPAPWRAIKDRRALLAAGLAALYGWYGRNRDLVGTVLRDVETHEITRRMVALRFEPALAAYRKILGAKLAAPQRALLHLALSFHTWRALVAESGLAQAEAVETMIRAIECARDARDAR